MSNEPTHNPMRCGARTRRGAPCRSWSVRGRRRCRMHGGKSTGPRTAEGRARIAAANTTHGERTKAAKAERAQLAKLGKAIRLLGKEENTEAEYQEIAEALDAFRVRMDSTAEALFAP
jgi:hypothetical protein